MPPRKKQKTASTSTSSTVSAPANFPNASVLLRGLSNYSLAISLRSKEHIKKPEELITLDEWLTNTESGLLSKIMSSQEVTAADMTSLMKWKLLRGKSRPTLLALIASNQETLVVKSTTTALKKVCDAGGDLDGALLGLPEACALKGVGAATASALLTLQPPHLLPFMSDEAASFFESSIGKIKYTDAFYKKFAAAMIAGVRRLNVDSEEEARWDSMKLERALFAIAILKKHGQERVLDSDSDPDAALPSASQSLKRRREAD
ncbi:hypothetical protein R3P38DRAFT_1182068 [Favolaschia claudopus]|uniref:HhH-GPD domain-containing protein n=1 Tax=Favolaschia claudopus TaxID=2862362 RepID=A0AAW0DY40_9AGAR